MRLHRGLDECLQWSQFTIQLPHLRNNNTVGSLLQLYIYDFKLLYIRHIKIMSALNMSILFLCLRSPTT